VVEYRTGGDNLHHRARQLECLKAVASRGGLSSFVKLTTSEIGEMLHISQQSASRWIGHMLDEGLLERRFISGRPHLAVTGPGAEMLRKELVQIASLLGGDTEKVYHLRGRLAGGSGEGRYYIGQAGYREQIEEKFSFVPFRGTFNIVVFPGFMNEFERLSTLPAVLLKEFTADGRSFGEVRCRSGEIRMTRTGKSTTCVILQPRRTHHTDTLEILAPFFLREFFGAVDGDEFEVSISTSEPGNRTDVRTDGGEEEKVVAKKTPANERKTEGALRP